MQVGVKQPTKEDFDLAEGARNGFESWLWGTVYDAIWSTMGSGKRSVVLALSTPRAKRAKKYLEGRLPEGYSVGLWYGRKPEYLGTSRIKLSRGIVVRWSDLMDKEIEDV